MEKFLRLFDCLYFERVKQKPVLLASKLNGAYKKLSSKQIIDDANALTNGLIKLGIQHKNGVENQDKIGLISNSRPEWLITDFATQQSGAVLVPLYPNTNIDDIIYVFNEAEVKYAFVNSKLIYKKLSEVKSQIPSLKDIYTFDEGEGTNPWRQILSQPNESEIVEIEKRKQAIQEDDIATIIYTSGTTGKPKGVMLSHKNIVSNVKNVKDVIEEIGVPEENKKSLSFLPLNHIFEKTVTYIYIYNGYSIYYAEGMETIADNLKEVRPALFVTVPRLLEKVYEKIMKKGSELKGIKKLLFFWAVRIGNKYKIEGNNSFYNIQLAISNKLIFNKWRAALGGNVKAIVVGGAACPPKLATLFSAAGITIMEGYGLTETSPVITVNRYGKENRMIGTIGTVINQVEVKLADDGEILCKGENNMVGYYKNPQETNEMIIDGWLHTGDIGTLVNGKFYKIIDRKKELFKNSGGKYIAPQPIENLLKESFLIEQAMVCGVNEKFVGALIVPNFDNMKIWMHDNKISYTDIESALNNAEVMKKYKSIIDEVNTVLTDIEKIKKFKLLTREFSLENGELTPKLSMKRKIICEHFADEINAMFNKP
ncbi:MAG: long-chain fatty acid--CoA ligase [Bacteroidia bacterium]|nr:long-chain fatty acid--CoA ligase [Bacteroidia bacterium]MCO5254693.1 long-chain fatty acid--CoA ligase [Bacteroidota bacterium]MCZ2130518.1 long-chain fatty acid--CoA ligase [Bacteroidia bacterium]